MEEKLKITMETEHVCSSFSASSAYGLGLSGLGTTDRPKACRKS